MSQIWHIKIFGFENKIWGPFWAKNDQTWQGCWCPKVVYEGPKLSKMINITYFFYLGLFWAHLDSFGSFQTKLNFLLQITLAKKHFSVLRQKIKFCLKWSKRVQMGPKWPQMAKNMLYWSFWIILDPRRPLWDISNPAMFGHFWPKKGFFGPPFAHGGRKARAKTASN